MQNDAKGIILHAERPHIKMQKTVFYAIICRLLQNTQLKSFLQKLITRHITM